MLGTSPAQASNYPPAFAEWVKTGKYNALITETKIVARKPSDQVPKTDREKSVLDSVLSLTSRQFEYAVAGLLEMMDARFVGIEVTRGVRDGGRDVIAKYRVGHGAHAVLLDVSVEAKLWTKAGAIGVRPMMRLISRLKHRDFGVFVTTSFFDKMVQEELIEDGHPVVLVSGGDIARILIENDIEGETLTRWLERLPKQDQGINGRHLEDSDVADKLQALT